MKIFVRVAKVLFALAFIFVTANLSAQTFTTLRNFSLAQSGGYEPSGSLILNNNVLYGIDIGGANGNQIFSINVAGTGLNAIYSFANSPSYDLASAGDTLYATTFLGGTNNNGTLCSVKTNGLNPQIIYQFQGGTNGAFPLTIISASNILYGTTQYGNWGNPLGISGGGVLYSIDTNGNNFAILHTFDVNQAGYSIVLKDNTFFGTTVAQTNAFIFSVDISGGNFTNLYSFTNGMAAINLIYNEGMLYGIGVSNAPGNFDAGIIFSMNTNGSNFNVLKTFTNIPYCLLLTNNLLWGCTFAGGFYNGGTLFSIKTNGANYNVLYNFPHSSSLAYQSPATMVASGNNFFGTTQSGGTNNLGSVFCFDSSPTLQSMFQSNESFNMTWSSASNAIYQLQYSTNLLTTNWFNMGNNSTATTSNIIFSDSATNLQRFYRLIYQP